MPDQRDLPDSNLALACRLHSRWRPTINRST